MNRVVLFVDVGSWFPAAETEIVPSGGSSLITLNTRGGTCGPLCMRVQVSNFIGRFRAGASQRHSELTTPRKKTVWSKATVSETLKS